MRRKKGTGKVLTVFTQELPLLSQEELWKYLGNNSSHDIPDFKVFSSPCSPLSLSCLSIRSRPFPSPLLSLFLPLPPLSPSTTNRFAALGLVHCEKPRRGDVPANSLPCCGAFEVILLLLFFFLLSSFFFLFFFFFFFFFLFFFFFFFFICFVIVIFVLCSFQPFFRLPNGDGPQRDGGFSGANEEA